MKTHPPIMEKIWGNGASYTVSDIDWTTSGCDGESEAGAGDGNQFIIGQNTNYILADIGSKAGVSFNILSSLSKYIARSFIGNNTGFITRNIRWFITRNV